MNGVTESALESLLEAAYLGESWLPGTLLYDMLTDALIEHGRVSELRLLQGGWGTIRKEDGLYGIWHEFTNFEEG